MKTSRLLAFALVLALSSMLDSQLSTALAQGSLTPLGAPGPTMKSLDQIEARKPISSTPFLITSSGSYYLTTNVSVSSGNAITIGANGVTLDLNGFTISSTAPSATGDGIQLSSSVRDVTIVNGHIRGGVVESGGVYSGSGFADGITYLLGAPVNVLVSHVTVSGCLDYGIYLNIYDSTVVESCTVRTVGSEGIYASIIRDSSAIDCGGDAIYSNQTSNSEGQSAGTGNGIFASAGTQNCYGVSSGGNGISTTTAQNCFGHSTSGDGMNATVAETCFAYSSSGTGLIAVVANSCFAETSSGTAEIISFKYNMP
jgi:hypothetical protein